MQVILEHNWAAPNGLFYRRGTTPGIPVNIPDELESKLPSSARIVSREFTPMPEISTMKNFTNKLMRREVKKEPALKVELINDWAAPNGSRYRKTSPNYPYAVVPASLRKHLPRTAKIIGETEMEVAGVDRNLHLRTFDSSRDENDAFEEVVQEAEREQAKVLEVKRGRGRPRRVENQE